MPETAVKRCFVIGPIGEPGKATRINADWLLRGIIRPVLKEKLGFEVQRADEISQPGMIDSQVINAVIDADLVIADLSEDNPNAFYELAIRHMEGRPVIHMTREGKIPFDVQPYRTILFSTVSHEDVETAKVALEKQVNEVLSPDYEVDNPITTARGKKKWQETATGSDKLIIEEFKALSSRVAETEGHIFWLLQKTTSLSRALMTPNVPSSLHDVFASSGMTLEAGGIGQGGLLSGFDLPNPQGGLLSGFDPPKPKE
jgi:hypothetical protein